MRSFLSGPATRDLVLEACACAVTVRCHDAASAALVTAGFGRLLKESTAGEAPLLCTVRTRGGRHHLTTPDRDAMPMDAAALLHALDRLLTFELQHRRPSLYFVHAAAVASGGSAALFAAPSGAGKSWLTLALLNLGHEYLSDELAPLDARRAVVWPYPHALCLKTRPATTLPATAVSLGTRLHLPIDAAQTAPGPRPLSAIFFVRRDAASSRLCTRLMPATAAAHLTANALNTLAHRHGGLAVAATVARRTPCFELNSADLDATVAVVRSILADHPAEEHHDNVA